jgi:undecaprenyl diphosphate synthase
MTGHRDTTPLPRHVAIIMDGNGRWAEERGLPRTAGHERGADAVRDVVRAAREIGIPALTLYAFSAQNWGRPVREVAHLMELLRRFLVEERAELVERGIRLHTIGDDERLPRQVRAPLLALRRATARGRQMTLCLALSYGARESIVAAARTLAAGVAEGRIDARSISEASIAGALSTRVLPPLDLLIRTSGEQRLSNFLLWEAAYAELYFTPVPWPDFGRPDLEAALAAFAGRQRRYGLAAAVTAGH